MGLKRIDILLTVFYLGVLVLTFFNFLIAHMGILSSAVYFLSPLVGGVCVGYFATESKKAVYITIVGSLLYPVVVFALLISVEPIFDAYWNFVQPMVGRHAWKYPLVVMMSSVVGYPLLYVPFGMVGAFIGGHRKRARHFI